MAPRATATAQGDSQPTLTKRELPAHKTTYVVRKADMEELLKKTFGAGLNFNVSTKSGRWIYYAERALTDLEVRKWIAELEARARAGGPDSSEESGDE